jgi:hypothetical protein
VEDGFGAGGLDPERRGGMNALAPVISTELKKVLRQVKLGCCLDTLPGRLVGR